MRKTKNKKFNLFYAKVARKKFFIILAIILFSIALVLALIADALRENLSDEIRSIFGTIETALIVFILVIPLFLFIRNIYIRIKCDYDSSYSSLKETFHSNHYNSIVLCPYCKKAVLNFDESEKGESYGSPTYSGSIGGESFSVSERGGFAIPPTATFICPRCEHTTSFYVSHKFITPGSENLKKYDRESERTAKEEKKRELADLDKKDKKIKK